MGLECVRLWLMLDEAFTKLVTEVCTLSSERDAF